MKQVLNADETAEYLRVTVITVRKLARQGEIPCQKVGRDYRFLSSSLDAWLTGSIKLKEKKEDIWDYTNAKDPTIGILESVTTDEKYEKLLEQ